MAIVIFDNTNADAVVNPPTVPTVFGLAQPTFIRRVLLYFFNGGIGANLSTTVTLADPGTNAAFGPFVPIFSAGQNGDPNVNVEIFPNVVLPPGNFQIVPTNQVEWSQNPRSGGQGFARIEGDLVGAIASPPTNQYERANWATNRLHKQRILWLQLLGVSASYLAIYRITNSADSTPATVETDQGSFLLEPGVSADVSAQKIEISSVRPAWGTYQDICCALSTVPPAAPRPPLPPAKNGEPPPPPVEQGRG
jgi:hypothetical protein